MVRNFFTVDELAEILGIHRVTVIKIIKERDDLGVIKVGRQYRIPKDSIFRLRL